ncbi:NAD-dependent epimerase/dehydratase family protein [Geomonas sp. RF6]|uniref:NAD-dependent epimerase/dehydratase family protein n=1 Tax=Geomonas sp. RF6 TaxID=2897342 RepID=UPI001E35D868|nr:NAD-dependent epimerase/dehydratase family protein [Geomonas sp. RF6]UFS71043.1 NAD-dependent epimerase/dehydratase family protein [Geomonas sp. RF6]
MRDTATAQALAGKKLLITGAAGYLAAALTALLRDVECTIVRVHRHGAPLPHPGGKVAVVDVAGDVRDPRLWEGGCLEGVSTVFHLAAQTSSYAADADPVADHAANVLPMLHLLEQCRHAGSVPAVCFSSTVTIAGLPQLLPVNESHPDHPVTMYDLHKQMAEQYLSRYSELGAVHGVALRLPNVYGPGPRSSRSDRGILNQMIRRALAGEPLTVYGAGDQLRDYLYVEDVARALVAAALHAEALSGEHFVIGSGTGYTIAQALALVAERCRAKTGTSPEIRHIDPPQGLSPIEARNFVADYGRFWAATGWEPAVPLPDGIDRTLEAYL